MKRNKKIGIITFSIFAIFAILFVNTVNADVECASQDCEVNTTLTVGNSAPEIDWVEDSISITLTGESTSNTASVLFNATDINGIIDLDDATAECVGYKSGEIDRTSTSCTNTGDVSNTRQFNCSFNSFAYYDVDGADWAWNCTISDDQASEAENSTETFTINSLDYIDQDLSTLTWTSVTANQNDQEADAEINFDNGGNQDYETANVTAYDSINDSSSIPASAFALNSATSTPAGTAMSNDTAVDISSWFTLVHGNGAYEDIFAYIDCPVVPAGIYLSSDSWTIDIGA